MTPPWSPTDEQLTRFLRGDCTGSELSAIQEWLTASAEHARRADVLRWLLASPHSAQWNVDALWAKVRADTVDVGMPPTRAPGAILKARRAIFVRHPWRVSIAASILVALMGTAGWLGTRPPMSAPRAITPSMAYQTTRGQSTTVQLADGSRVRLAPMSRLVVAPAFGDSLRELTLDGEAEFVVHHDASRPFRVSTRTTVTEDIGTRFTIRAYRTEPKVLVAVAEGAVTLGRRMNRASRGGGPQGMLLRVGEIGTLDSSGTLAISRGLSVARALAWTKSQLVFDNQPLSDVLSTISRWYTLDIRVADGAVAAHRVTAAFSTQSADQMLRALATAVDAKVERNGRHVTLKRR